MKVVFDSQIFELQRHGGISRYVTELALAMARLPEVQARVLAPLHVNALLAGSGAPTAGPAACVPGWPARLRQPLAAAWSAAWLALGPPDVLHATYYGRHRRPRGAGRLVLTVHDMIHERFPGDFGPHDDTAACKRAAVAAADHVICVSDSTRRDLCQLYGLAPERISVVPHGVRPLPAVQGPPPLPPGAPYLLHVGARGGYKNFSLLLRALAASAPLRTALRVVAFGGGPWTAAERELITRAGLGDGQVLQMAGDDALLSTLYRHAACLVYPSRYEGFGMPLLEAMALNCPVVSASGSALPEAAGPAATYFDTESADAPAQLAAAIERATGDPARRAELQRLGAERAAAFTWERAARQTLQAYQRTG
ncbi:MAG: hypothetical protein RJA10_3521 [Pseudomonadota bacterium]|jgi:glycosyltransferase involved in cell wall biosynthesis